MDVDPGFSVLAISSNSRKLAFQENRHGIIVQCTSSISVYVSLRGLHESNDAVYMSDVQVSLRDLIHLLPRDIAMSHYYVLTPADVDRTYYVLCTKHDQ